MEGEQDGIRYVNYYHMNWQDHFETLVISRHPTYCRPGTKAERIFFDWQDIKVPADSYTPEILARYDKIFCKSQYQRIYWISVPIINVRLFLMVSILLFWL